MVLRNHIRIIWGIIAFVLLTLSFSCEEIQLLTVDCDECYQDDPKEVYIFIKQETRFGGDSVFVYEGNIEDNVLFDSFYSSSSETSIKVTVNKKYTVVVKYHSHTGANYTAIDAVTPHVRYEENACDSPCYYPYDNKADLRLKYLK
jgi:hypothetical protein